MQGLGTAAAQQCWVFCSKYSKSWCKCQCASVYMYHWACKPGEVHPGLQEINNDSLSFSGEQTYQRRNNKKLVQFLFVVFIDKGIFLCLSHLAIYQLFWWQHGKVVLWGNSSVAKFQLSGRRNVSVKLCFSFLVPVGVLCFNWLASPGEACHRLQHFSATSPTDSFLLLPSLQCAVAENTL